MIHREELFGSPVAGEMTTYSEELLPRISRITRIVLKISEIREIRG